ncbi:MAG TPA: hypothetical protein DDZ51_08835 [Planctomycetaceae bacterium]|nr:hypothetical protein [Planctomycetaceae bacterium]
MQPDLSLRPRIRATVVFALIKPALPLKVTGFDLTVVIVPKNLSCGKDRFHLILTVNWHFSDTENCFWKVRFPIIVPDAT